MLNHYMENVRMLDAGVKKLLEIQCIDAANPCYGVASDIARGFDEPCMGLTVTQQLIEAYYTPESAYYHDDMLMERAVIAMRWTLQFQHEDGSLDLLETNFHDSAESAFTIHELGPAYKVMKHFTRHTPAEDALEELVVRYMNGAADAMVNLGFHTPNHRWVISAALCYCWKLLEREDCRAHIDDFLREGIDCDENGEYTERSAGIYNIICNRAMCIMARELDMPELYAHVRRNLGMVLTYIEPDCTISTINSRRQDVGKAPDWSAYYTNFLQMAIQTGDADLAWVADRMLEKLMEQKPAATNRPMTYYQQYSELLLNPEQAQKIVEQPTCKPTLNYDKFYEASGVVRFREGDFSATLVKDRPVFVKFQYKAHAAYLRLSGSFFARGQFVAQEIEKTPYGYEMRFHDRWGYKRPLPEAPASSNWHEMDHSKRQEAAMQDIWMTVRIKLSGDGMDVSVSASGCAHIPSKLELIFEPNGHYMTSAMATRAKAGNYFFQKGDSEYVFDDHTGYAITGAFNEHNSGETLRGTMGVDDQNFFVAMTAFTPFEKTVHIRAVDM